MPGQISGDLDLLIPPSSGQRFCGMRPWSAAAARTGAITDTGTLDADLNAGLITEQEARQRRELIAREAEYYGAMDGANKFVRGDAIAGIVITLINIIGGLAIGVFQKDMSFANAAQNYTLLTIGDGLVTQVPALIVSTAAGLIVSRAGTEASLGKEITSQILFQPRAIAITAIPMTKVKSKPGLRSNPSWYQ